MRKYKITYKSNNRWYTTSPMTIREFSASVERLGFHVDMAVGHAVKG